MIPLPISLNVSSVFRELMNVYVQLRFNPITTRPSIQPKHPFLLYLTMSNILSELSSPFHIMRSFSFACDVGINQYCRFVDFFKNVESGHPEPVAD